MFAAKLAFTVTFPSNFFSFFELLTIPLNFFPRFSSPTHFGTRHCQRLEQRRKSLTCPLVLFFSSNNTFTACPVTLIPLPPSSLLSSLRYTRDRESFVWSWSSISTRQADNSFPAGSGMRKNSGEPFSRSASTIAIGR